ncbi:hypothetical protein LMF93_24285, partial [Salmonella enterica subsp. enterica serovar Typhimurium]|nr:hypothetical protein [Salmonella enterica subsp. enterica serovar Typhimurium]
MTSLRFSHLIKGFMLLQDIFRLIKIMLVFSLMGAEQKFLKLMENIYVQCDIKLGSSFDHQ